MPSEKEITHVVNKQSGYIYKIVAIQVGTDEELPTYQIPVYTISRCFDGMQVQLGQSFDHKYRSAAPHEIALLKASEGEFKATRMPVSIDMLYEATSHAPGGPSPRTGNLPAEPTRGEIDAENEARAIESGEGMAELNGQNPRKPRKGEKGGDAEENAVGILIDPDERFTFERLIVPDEVKTEITMGLDLILHRAILDTEWGLSEISPQKGRCIMNFKGPPGTGKTMAAKCIARRLGKKLYQVDYAEMISKWVGDTAKHIRAAFVAAKKLDAILFFDEADSMLSKRISMPQDGCANSINQNRNVLMQEMDRYDGIMLTATNFFQNFDEAMLRRISQHIHFPLPGETERHKLFLIHIPRAAQNKLAEDVLTRDLAEKSDGLSGGDILVVCENAIKRAFTESKSEIGGGKLFQRHFLSEIENVKRRQTEHRAA